MEKPFTITASIIALQRGRFYSSASRLKDKTVSNVQLAYTVQAKLMQLGYMLTEEALKQFSIWAEEDIIRYHNEVIPYITYIKGDGDYRPLYDGFPKQVIEMSEIELFINAIIHYLSAGTWVPNSYTDSRPVAFEHAEYRMLDTCTETEFNHIFTDILSVNQSITPMDKEVLEWFFNNCSQEWMLNHLPKDIPFKENLCFVLAECEGYVPGFTFTDILRTATYMSGGDISLASNTRFCLSNKKRDKIMRLLEMKMMEKEGKVGHAYLDSLEDLKKHRNKWLALFNHMHADSKRYHKPAYQNAQKAVELLRFHDDKIQTWNSKVENSSGNRQLELLKQRPGEFARKLNKLIKDFGSEEVVKKADDVTDLKKMLAHFREIAPRISNKVLFELYRYFEGRYEKQVQRTVFIKGSRKPKKLVSMDALPAETIDEVQEVILSAIRSKLTAWPKMGKVVLDEKLKNIPLPTNMRTVSETDVPMVRGTRIPISADHTKTVRFYVHWHDAYGKIDLDLSANLVGTGKFDYLSFDSAYVIGGENTIGVHSGDVRCRKGDCAEYVDIDIQNALKYGYRYIIIDVRNFNEGSLKSVNPAFGYMEREFPESNDIWCPQAVASSWRLQSEAQACIAVMIDLKSKEYIPLDIDSNSIMATNDKEAVLTAMRMYMDMPKLSVYDLLTWHIQARGGEIVDKATEDEKVECFKFEDFCGSYMETLKWMAETPPGGKS